MFIAIAIEGNIIQPGLGYFAMRDGQKGGIIYCWVIINDGRIGQRISGRSQGLQTGDRLFAILELKVDKEKYKIMN